MKQPFLAFTLGRILVLTSALAMPVVDAQSPTDSVRFAVFGDYGSGSANQQRVAELVNQWAVDYIATTGDSSYGGTGLEVVVGQFFRIKMAEEVLQSAD